MENNKAFLVHFLEEEIYVADKVATTPTADTATTEAPVVEPTKQETPTASKPEEVTKPPVELTFTGNKSPEVLLLVGDITQEEKVFMAKILAAIKLDLKSCALLRRPENNTPEHTTLIKAFEVKTVINFGTDIYQNDKYAIGGDASKRILCADSLSVISSDQSKKKQLWGCLQKLFL